MAKVNGEGSFGLVDLSGHKRKAWNDLSLAYRN